MPNSFIPLLLMPSSSNTSCCLSKFVEAYDALDPNGNITIKWDVMAWTPDGYVVSIDHCSCTFNQAHLE